jgi:RNA polymerase sigma-70 factor (ECF subfamily)
VTALAELDDEAVLAVHVDADRPRPQREAAFDELVRRFQRRVFAVCRRTLHDDADAEEVTQEVFVRLARKAATFRGDAKLSTWLYAVARNASTDRVRHEARRPSTPVGDVVAVADDVGPTAADEVEARATALDVGRALEQLDELSRELLWLVAVEGLSYAEAAAVHDLAVGTVKSRVSRARVQLGQLLADDGPTPEAPTAIHRRPATSLADPTTPVRGPPDR